MRFNEQQIVTISVDKFVDKILSVPPSNPHTYVDKWHKEKGISNMKKALKTQCFQGFL